MAEDFFMGFAAHAHTRSDLVPDPNLEMQLRKENNAAEARRLAEAALGKIEGEACIRERDGQALHRPDRDEKGKIAKLILPFYG